MLIGFRRGQGSIILRIKILNSSVSTGAGLTGLVNTSSGLIISTIADTESTATAYTAAASNIETITTNGTFAAPTAGKCRFKEVDATNHKGVYEIQIADARFSVSSAKSLLVSVAGATNAAETDVVIPLRDLDPYDGTSGGLSRLDAAVSSRLASASYTAPPTAGAIADAVWDEATTGHTTAGTYGGQVLRGANSNVEVQVTGSNHVAADMHESQPGSIHAATFDAGAIDAAALATDAVAEIVSGVLTTQMTESYRATNAAPTLAQAAFELIAHMGEASISSTTKTLKKLDGSTTAKTYTLDSSTTPTSITEAT